jgi:cell division inhibitor SepF
MWRKAMVSLGLVDDDPYDDVVDDESDHPEMRDRAGGPSPRGAGTVSQPSSVSALGPSASPPDEPSSAVGTVRPISGSPDDRPAPSAGQVASPTGVGGARPRPQVVRPIAVTPNAKPHLVAPSSFNEAQEVADKFKQSQPVVMNLQDADRELSRRLIDFASGLCYGLGGQMERIANQVYLLTPTSVEVSADERRRMHDRGYDA